MQIQFTLYNDCPANAVIKYSPGVIEKDITFTEGLSNSYIAEAIFIRTLCYFYLVRTFDRVPLVLEPYVDDSQGFNVQVAERNVILNQLISDLKKYAPMCKPGYEVDWQNKGRATSWACYALLARHLSLERRLRSGYPSLQQSDQFSTLFACFQ